MRSFCVFLISLGLLACAESAKDSLADARKALTESRYADAIASADQGLAARGDEVTLWGLELVKLEALARSGQGDAAVAQIEQLAAERPDQFPARQYAASAGQLHAAGQSVAAIQVLDLGLARFPQDETLRAGIEQAKKAPKPGSGDLEMLRSLGYVE